MFIKTKYFKLAGFLSSLALEIPYPSLSFKKFPLLLQQAATSVLRKEGKAENEVPVYIFWGSIDFWGPVHDFKEKGWSNHLTYITQAPSEDRVDWARRLYDDTILSPLHTLQQGQVLLLPLLSGSVTWVNGFTHQV